MTTVQSSPAVLRFTRASAVVITAAIGVGSFVLSFAALRDLATRAGWPLHLAWLWPLIVDGAILMATMAVVALAPYDDQGKSRRFFWLVLASSAAVSIVCNALHAVIPRAAPLSPWLAGAIAMVPPTMLLAATHGLSLLAKVKPPSTRVNDRAPEEITVMPAEFPEEIDHADDISENRAQWAQMAARLDGHPAAAGLDVAQIVDVLYLSFERALSNRSIARHLDMDPRIVGKLVAASTELLQAGRVDVSAAIAPGRRAMASDAVVRNGAHAALR